MNRRAFIAGLCLTGHAWPRGAFGINSATPRVAVLGIEPLPKLVTVFEQAMRASGWVKDTNVYIDYRWGGTDPEKTKAVAAELIDSSPSVIVTIGSPATVASRNATSSIPVVFAVVSDPVGQGLVTSLAHPGGNITGFSHFDTGIGGKWVQLIREIAPETTRFASLFKPALGSYAELFQRSMEDAARSLGIEVTRAPVLTDNDINAVFEQLAGATNIALLVPSDPFTFVRSRIVAALAAKYRVPAIYPARQFVDDGGLVAYGPDLWDQVYSSASYVNRILKGETPGDLPVQAPTKFEFVINLKAARDLSLDIPLTLLARADEVIE